MRLLKEMLGVLGGLVVIAVIGAFVAPKTTHAVVAALVQIVPGTTTHVGQNESQLVSLVCELGTDDCVAVDPEGKLSSTGYVVPSGYTLIVTDWQWEVTGATPGVRWADHLFTINNLGLPLGTLANSYATPDQNGATYAHERFATGIRVGSGVTMADGRADDGTGDAFIQGYLVPND